MAMPPPRPVIACIHCGKPITEVKAEGWSGWVDEDGFAVCMKFTGPRPAATTSYLGHQPMPPGFRGGPPAPPQ